MRETRLDRKGFTLVELLVVMAVIAIFVGGIGLALTRGDGVRGVESGQRTIAGLMSAARSQAIMNQTNTRLIIHFDPPANAGDTEKRGAFLRFVGVIVRRDGYWEAVNDGSYLPRGVYVVPPWDFTGPGPDKSLIHNHVIRMENNDNYWDRRSRSVVNLEVMRYNFGHNYELDPNPNPTTEDYYLYIEFDSRGRVTHTTTELSNQNWERRLVIAPAREGPHLPEFEANGHSNARGGMILQSGAFVTVNLPATFPVP